MRFVTAFEVRFSTSTLTIAQCFSLFLHLERRALILRLLMLVFVFHAEGSVNIAFGGRDDHVLVRNGEVAHLMFRVASA